MIIVNVILIQYPLGQWQYVDPNMLMDHKFIDRENGVKEVF